MSAVVIVLYIVVSAVTSCLVSVALMRTRGVRGVRALQRDVDDIQADYAAMAKRLKKMQTSSAGEASVEAKKSVSRATVDFVEAKRLQGSAQSGALGQ